MGVIYKLILLYSVLITAILLGAFFAQRMNGVLYSHEFYSRAYFPPEQWLMYREVIEAGRHPETLVEKYTLSFENSLNLSWLQLIVALVVLSLPLTISRVFPILRAFGIGLIAALMMIGFSFTAWQMNWFHHETGAVDTLIAVTLYTLLGLAVLIETIVLYLVSRDGWKQQVPWRSLSDH